MLPGGPDADICTQVRNCSPGQTKTKADWILWGAIVLNAVFTITAFWWSQRNEAKKKYRCLHFLAVEFDNVMQIMDATVRQCELVLDRLVDTGVAQLADVAPSYADVFQPSAARTLETRRRDEPGLKSAINVRNLRVRALCERARRLKDEAEVLCKITGTSEDRRHVQRLIECLATITYIDSTVIWSGDDPSYLSRLVTRDLANDLLRSGRRVLAICCRRFETPPGVLRKMSGHRLLMNREQRQSFEIWEKYIAKQSDSQGQAVKATDKVKDSGLTQRSAKNAPIKAFEASITTMQSFRDVGRTVFNDVECISEGTLTSLRQVRNDCGGGASTEIKQTTSGEDYAS